MYGYSLDDDITDKFEFYYQEGKPFLKVLDKTIKKVNQTVKVLPDHLKKVSDKVVSTADYTKSIGIIINLNSDHFPFFKIEIVSGIRNKDENTFKGKIESLDTSKYIDLNPFAPEDRSVANAAKKLQEAEINKFITKNSPFGDL